jgi:hypothetical protein
MDAATIGFIGIAAMLVLILLLGMSPGLAMLTAGFCGLLALHPPATFSELLQGSMGAELWSVFSNYGFTVIPLFVLLVRSSSTPATAIACSMRRRPGSVTGAADWQRRRSWPRPGFHLSAGPTPRPPQQ